MARRTHMGDDGLAARFQVMQAVAREAGAAAHAMLGDPSARRFKAKGPQDFVSRADAAIEALIIERLAAEFPEDGFLGEEGGVVGGDAAGLWVIDPIDGTANFISDIPVWCVSIAYHSAGQAVLGAIHDPNADELFAARRGGGAFLNGRPIGASAATGLDQGTVAIGHSGRVSAETTLAALSRLLAAGGMYQRNGSGALSLAYVAAGRLLGYFEAHINAWDCLAGIVLVEEAGGWVNDFLAKDGLHRGNPIVAAAPALAGAMRGVAGL